MSFKPVGACELRLLRFLTLCHTRESISSSSQNPGFNRYLRSTVIAYSVFYLTFADVFLSDPCSNLPTLPLAVTGLGTHSGDVPCLSLICTGLGELQFPQHMGQGAPDPIASGVGLSQGWSMGNGHYALAAKFPSAPISQPINHHQGHQGVV